MPVIYQPGQRIDHYEIVKKLGQGPSSRIYLAHDCSTPARQQVVLKFPIDDVIGGAAILQRFQREKELGKVLSHPAIQRHLNIDEPRSQDYIVLEYLTGQTVRELLVKRSPGTFTPEEVQHLLIPVCEALLYAHEHGVIHRDIKPDNVFLLEDGTVKILDFGIALVGKKSRLPWSSLSQIVGTPDYMPPERLQGAPGDVRTDVYAVGIMMYELLCGRTPYQETDGFAFVSQHISHDPPGILSFAPGLSPAWATITMRAIRRDPERRYASIRDLLHDLKHPQSIVPEAYIPAPPKLGGRFRQIMFISLVILIVLVAIVLLGILAQFAHR
ncbi:MAG TPA: serine/threonine-protein kinase [Ktedonobacteraceae bacterium]|nr:serine/threonine-protein kinase [Ktedonobacteraceae bacterium]